jgi:Mg2+ and Co2+ transporter CorA
MHELEVKSCRSFIIAILTQAYFDAINLSDSKVDHIEAKRFISPKNNLFSHYAKLLLFDPEWLAEKMQHSIINNRIKSLSIMRE